MTDFQTSLSHVSNPRVLGASAYPAQLENILNREQCDLALEEISGWPGYAVTPQYELTHLADAIGVEKIWYKDESRRFQLKSFKALGGAYAVLRLLQDRVREDKGVSPSLADLQSGRFADCVADVVVSCATDGNHGRSVAWGCQMCGCRCIIYIHRDVSVARQQAMEAFGAEVIRIDGNYDDSVRLADEEAQKHGRVIVSDTSYPGYMEIPRNVMIGYTVMLSEAVEQMQGQIPTHVFIQAGVGGLAAAVCAFFWERFGEHRPRFIVVEPERANCLQASARAGEPVAVEGDLETLMAGLSCGEVSALAWPVLDQGAHDFMTLGEDAVAPCMRLLRRQDPPIEAGESAVAGLATALAAGSDPALAAQLGFDRESRIFVIGTEGATDPELYQRLVAA